MDKRLTDKTALITYISVLWGIAMFIITFILEGWNMQNIDKVLNHPVGILALLLIVGCIILFIWNLRRAELTHEQWEIKRNIRLPELHQLKQDISDYLRNTYLLTRNENLYKPDTYDLGQGLSPKIIPFVKLLNNNIEYQKLKVDGVSELRESLESSIERLGNKRLKKLVYKVIEWEHRARSQQIIIRLFRTKYPQIEITENKLLIAESHTKEPNKVRIFGKHLRGLYKYIGIMERGGDL